MPAENKAVVRRFIEEGWNHGNIAALEDTTARDYVGHDPANPPELAPGLEGVKQQVKTYRAAFPDIHFAIEDIIAEDDKVVIRYTGTGTHQGDLMGAAPTHKRATVTGMGIFRIASGKIAEGWSNWDALGLMRQLGAIPPLTPSR